METVNAEAGNELSQGSDNKKRLFAFIAVAYGISFLMMIPMYIGKQKGLDLTQLVNAQMCSPAAGVALGYLLFMKGEKRVPKMFMIVLVINYLIQVLLGLLSVFANPFRPDEVYTIAEGVELPLGQVFYLIGQYVLIAGSVLLWIGYFTAGKERRRFAGLSRNNEKMGILMVLLFTVLYLARTLLPAVIEYAVTDSISEFTEQYAELLKNPTFYLAIVSLPFNYPLTIIAFLGEEYGWRYYLQPVMQKKFGMKAGIILLGLVWGIWHLPVDVFFYTEDSIPQMIIGQWITCIFLGIFFGFVYLKTNNIWIPVCMHFLNNNLIPIITGQFTAEVMENQHVPWGYLVEVLIIDVIIFGLFIFAKEYKEKKKEKIADA